MSSSISGSSGRARRTSAPDQIHLMFVGTTNGIIDYWDAGGPINDQSPGPGAWYPAFGASCYPNNGVINCLLYNNGVWAGSTDGLCIQYMGGEGNWLLQNTETGWYSSNITSIQKNPNNNMLAIGTMNGGLVTYDQEFDVYYSSNSDILDNTVFDAVFDQNNNIIICTPQAGLGVLTEISDLLCVWSLGGDRFVQDLRDCLSDYSP